LKESKNRREREKERERERERERDIERASNQGDEEDLIMGT